VVCWKYRLCEVHTRTQNFSAHLHFALNDPTLKKQLFAKCNGTIGIFVHGGPAALDKNTSRHLGLANGSNVVLHSRVFNGNLVSSDKQNEIKHRINNTPAGETIFIDIIPLYIAISLKPTNAQLQKKLASSSHVKPAINSTPDWLAIKIYRCGCFPRF